MPIQWIETAVGLFYDPTKKVITFSTKYFEVNNLLGVNI